MNIIVKEIGSKLIKNKAVYTLAQEMLSKLSKYNINLSQVKIELQDPQSSISVDPLSSRFYFTTNKEAVYIFLNSVPQNLPGSGAIDTIIQFHKSCQYRGLITVDFCTKFVMNLQKAMEDKQMLAKWLNSVYGINLSQITTISLLPPNQFTNESMIELKLLSLLCLFYDLPPTSIIHKLQLYSIVYIKPNFALKSHCGRDYVLVLIEEYTQYLNKVVKSVE